jgi:hypothetical protein
VATSTEVAERLRLRYPPSRLPRAALIATVAVVAAVGLTWLLWAANANANPPVSGVVTSYEVLSDREVAFTLTVERPDPSKPAVCSVVAQSADYGSVGALDVEVPPREERVVDVRLTMKTLRRATNASYRSCSLR